SGRILFPLQVLALRDVGRRAFGAGLLVVPEREADRSLGLHVGTAEDAREFHDDRRPGAIVVRGLTPADAVHVAADDVHLLGMGRADLGADDVLPLAGTFRRRLRV